MLIPMMDPEYILKIQSVQSSNLRILFEVLKEVLLIDINIIFTKQHMKIAEMDSKEQALVHLILKSEAFEKYHCEDTVVAGINTSNFFKIIKIATNHDTVSFCIKRNNPSKLIVKLENNEKQKIFESSVRLLDVQCDNRQIREEISFPSIISLPSAELQKICRNMNSLGSREQSIEISSVDQQLIFKYEGDFSSQQVFLGKSDNTVFDTNSDEIIQGNFNLKFLLLFTKATNLCNTVKIYLKNDFPMVIEYSVGSLGSLKFLLNNI